MAPRWHWPTFRLSASCGKVRRCSFRRAMRSAGQSINRLIEDRPLRAELAAKAFERASIYSLDVQTQAMVQAWWHASGKRSLAA